VGCAAVAVRRIPTETSLVEGYDSAHPLRPSHDNNFLFDQDSFNTHRV
jgi:hypothetical protein